MVIQKSFISIIALVIIYSFSVVQPAGAQLAGIEPANVRFFELASGLTQPLFVTHAGDGSGRLFIVQRGGQILIRKNGSVLSTPFLSMQVNSSGGEQGLLGLAFHPDYETNGRFYTVHTDQSRAIVLSVFTRSSGNPDQANPNSQVTLLTIPKLYANHNGGTLAFGPDGYLYMSTGDGGSAGDPDNNAQNLNSLLGKILRLDVSSPTSYSVPPSNPFYNSTSTSIRKEIWAYGLRNPWRFSFDRSTGDIYIGDVGQGAREEIDFQPAGSGGGENYGWRVMEGSLCYNPSTGCNQSGKVLPVAEYSHSVGCSVTGGYVYRGSQYPQLNGYYFYGDFCSGLVYTLRTDSQSGWISQLVTDTPYSISTFGEDEQGELYMTDYSTGKIYQIAYIRPPAKATLISPAGEITNKQPVFSWNEAPENEQADPASWYYLWVDGPSGNVIKQWYQASDVCNGGACSVTSPATLSGGMYTWWIQTWNEGGYGPWSDGRAFSIPIPPLPGKATLVSPNGGIGNNNPAYTWNQVSGATWYYLWVDGPTDHILDKWYTSADANCNGSICSVAGATPNLGTGSHTWWIQTWNEGGYGPWSDGISFSPPTPTPPGKATLVSPNGGIGNNNPTYTWNEVSGATWYYLWVDGSTDHVFHQWYRSDQANCNGSICSVTGATPNLEGGTHNWYVQAWSSAGYGPWSDGMSFTLEPPGKATLVSPNGSQGAGNPTYTWNEVSGVTWYFLWIDGSNGNVFRQWYTSDQASCNGTTCSVTGATPGLAAGSYTWWVQTWSSAGYGPWSDGLAFSIP